MSVSEAISSSNFLYKLVEEDVATGRFGGRVQTRFPPEPNAYLHIGHARAMCTDFGVAQAFNGVCSLRFDDTNPVKEDVEYVESMIEDIHWLGFDWGDHLFYASDYFEQLYDFALQMIKAGKAYVDDLSADEIREYRGTLTEPGKNSPYRDRSVEENLDLFARMRAGEFPDGSRVLRAKIDMASNNLNMRDSVMYRILHTSHHRTGDKWCIYPMYDWAHGQSDSIEGVTHSLCSLEYEDHRPLYDWYLDQLGIHHPRQIEFARLNLSYTVLSKRKLLRLIKEGYIKDWDDPRMPTLIGFRRRGYTSSAIREFIDRLGLAKKDSSIADIALLESILRDELNLTAPRAMAVLRPVKLVIENYPEGQVEWVEAVNNPEDENAGTRTLPFSRELYVERDDFKEDAPKKWFRLAPGREVRLKHGYYVTCTGAIKDETGEVVELRCVYDPQTRGGWSEDGRKVNGTLHWVSAAHAVDAEVRLYDRLFTKPDPEEAEEGQDFTANVNPNSLEVLAGCKVEPGLAGAPVGSRYQFLRQGYFCLDSDSTATRPVFNRTVSLKDSWSKIEKTL